MAEPVTHRRSPERAAAVIDRASRMRAAKPSLLDRRLFDRQMRTPGAGKAPINFDYLKPEHVTPRGVQAVPTKGIVSDQPTVSIKAVKDKIAQTASGGATPTSGGKLPQILLHNGQYHVFDGNHRVTAARALGDRAVTGQVFELKPGVQRPVSGAHVGGAAMAIGAGISIAGTAAAAKVAHDSAKARGASDASAAAQATLAGAKQAATPVALSTMIGAAERYGPKALAAAANTVGKVALPASMAAMAGGYAWDAYKNGADAAGIAKAAGWGAVNGVLPIDVMRQAFGGPKPADQSFNAANRHYADLHMTHAPGPAPADKNRNRGTRNEANLKAIIANRQRRAAERAQ